MSEHITLHASDGQALGAYVAHPEGEPIAAMVVVQEIFGVNAHIRSVADGYARDGFLAIAPALFDRIEPNVELGYEGADAQRARSFIPKLNIDKSVADVAAAVDFLKATGLKVGVIGYCYGGTLAWLAACRLSIAAAVGYYGGRIAQYAEEKPTAPVMLHFGSQDAHIPAEEIETVQSAHPDVEIFLYDGAGHAFANAARPSYVATASDLAHQRALAFIKAHIVK